MLQNNRNAYLSSIWLTLGEKQFLLIFIPFTSLIKNGCLNKSKFSSVFAPFKHGKKKKFLSISVLVSEMSLLCLKRKVLYEFHPKCFKTTKRHSLVVFSSLVGEKHFLLIFSLYFWWRKKVFVNIYPLLLF